MKEIEEVERLERIIEEAVVKDAVRSRTNMALEAMVKYFEENKEAGEKLPGILGAISEELKRRREGKEKDD